MTVPARLSKYRDRLAQEAEHLRPAGPERAAEWAKILTGSYPTARPPEPEIYARAIISVLAECPADLGPVVVDRITRRSKWLPSRAEVAEAVEEVVTERRAEYSRMRRALAEHERRKAQAALEAQIERDRDTVQRGIVELLADLRSGRMNRKAV